MCVCFIYYFLFYYLLSQRERERERANLYQAYKNLDLFIYIYISTKSIHIYAIGSSGVYPSAGQDDHFITNLAGTSYFNQIQGRSTFSPFDDEFDAQSWREGVLLSGPPGYMYWVVILGVLPLTVFTCMTCGCILICCMLALSLSPSLIVSLSMSLSFTYTYGV